MNQRATASQRSTSVRRLAVALAVCATLAATPVVLSACGSGSSGSASSTTDPRSSDDETTSTLARRTSADISGLQLPGFRIVSDEKASKELLQYPEVSSIASDAQFNEVYRDQTRVGTINTLVLKDAANAESTAKGYFEAVAGSTGKIEDVDDAGPYTKAVVTSRGGRTHVMFVFDDSGLLVDAIADDPATANEIIDAFGNSS